MQLHGRDETYEPVIHQAENRTENKSGNNNFLPILGLNPMIQEIVDLYHSSGLLFLGIFLPSFVFYILAQSVTKDKLATVFFALAGLCAIGSLSVSIPLYVLILINSHRVTERYLKMICTAYTVGRAEGAKHGREDLDYIMHRSRFKDFESWKCNKLS